MHVAFVAPETVRHRATDALARLEGVAQLLTDRGHEVTVLTTPWWDADDVDEFEDDGVVYRALAEDPGRSYAVKLPMALRRLRPDVIHGTASAPGAAVAARGGKRLAGAPLVVEWFDEDVEGSMVGRAMDGADRIVVPSRLVRTALRSVGADGDDCVVVPNPVDFSRIRGTDPDPEVGGDVVYARRLDEGANLESLLLALAELRGYDWSATVVGDGPRRAEYEQQAADMRIDDRLTFVGEVDLDGRIAAYRAAHVFVQTARRCAFATDLLWALACGCVGIVEYHARSSAHELVEQADRGVRTTSEAELTQAIVDAGDREALDLNEAFAEYDRDAVLERYLAVYRELLDERGIL